MEIGVCERALSQVDSTLGFFGLHRRKRYQCGVVVAGPDCWELGRLPTAHRCHRLVVRYALEIFIALFGDRM